MKKLNFDKYLKNKKRSLIHTFWKLLMDYDLAHNHLGMAKNSEKQRQFFNFILNLR